MPVYSLKLPKTPYFCPNCRHLQTKEIYYKIRIGRATPYLSRVQLTQFLHLKYLQTNCKCLFYGILYIKITLTLPKTDPKFDKEMPYSPSTIQYIVFFYTILYIIIQEQNICKQQKGFLSANVCKYSGLDRLSPSIK